MKKILSFICMLAILCTVIAPLSVIEVSAAAFQGWTLSGGAYVDDDGVLHMMSTQSGSGSQATASASVLTGNPMLPDKYTIMYSMKVNSLSSSSGLQGGNGNSRAGYYHNSGGFRGMDTGQGISFSYLGEWHDFMIEVDHVNKIEKVYLDDEYVGTITLSGSGARNQFYFWSHNPGGNFEVSDFSIVTESTGSSDQLTLGAEYTEAFRQDWDTIGGWMVEPGEQVTHFPEEGIIRLHVVEENQSYRSIERPLRPPTNYDMEFRVMIPEEQPDIYSGMTAFELSTDRRHTWLYVQKDKITFNDYGATGGDVLYNRANSCVMVDMHDGQWHTWKAEVRDEHITWYIDGEELVNYEMLKTSTNRWHFSIFQQDEHKAQMDCYVDWVEYTPYFDDELKIIAPIERSVFAETKDIEFKAEVADESIEKVDYYVNNVLVGSGYKKDNYVYTLKNAKVGQYKLKAKVENIETPEMSFFVEKAFAAELDLDRTDIHYGETVKATVTANSVSEDTQLAKVNFYLNGKLYSTDNSAPFEATYSGMQVGTGAVFARAYSKLGTVFETTPGYINVDYVEGKPLEIGREYTIDYKYTSGTGSFTINDGYFALGLSHNGGSVTYETEDEGTVTYDGLGYGDYKVVVTAGYAELYWNNQFVTSFFAPYKPGAKNTSHSGVSDVSIKGSGVKAEVFHTDWEGQSEFVRDDIMDTTYYSVEFDKTDSSPETVEFYDGVFENVLSFREDGIYAKRQLSKSHPASEVKLTDTVEPGYYRLTVGYGIAQLNLNNVPIGNYRCNRAASKRALKRTMTNPSASTFFALKNTDDVYYHNDTFEEITELSSDNFWSVHPIRFSDGNKVTLTTTKVEEKSGNHYMNIKGKGVYLLNAIDQYPSFKWRGMVEEREGKVFTMFRRSFGDRHDKIGYNFDTNQWFYEMVQEKGTVIEADVKTDPTAFKEGQWYDFELVCEDFSVKLLCDGKEVFSTDFDNSLKSIYYGRLGFGAIDGEYNFDDVEYSGKNRASAGLYYTTGNRVGGAHVGNFYKDEDGTVYATHELNAVKSTDRGRTWSDFTVSASNPNNIIMSSDIVTMPDGTMVKQTSSSTDNGTVQSYISKNGGQSWEGPYLVAKGYGTASAVARLTCTMDGRLFLSTTMGGEYYGKMFVFYSDDGITWTKSETDFTSANTGIIMNECIIVDTPRENEVWFWGRSDSGFLDYWVSYDNGKTFDLTPHHSGLMQSETCFRIERDWNNPDTYYAIFIYDTETSNDRYIQQPRNRATLGVSYDGMETWEFVCDIMEANSYPSLHTSDAMLKIIDDQIYWRTSNYSGNGGVNFGVQDIDKIKTLKRMPEFHKRVYLGTDTMKHLAYEHCVLPKADGEAFIYGDFYDAKVADGRTDLDTVAKVFGVTVEKSGSAVMLTMGGGKVTFTEGSTSYDVNGETRTAERAVYSGGMLDIKTLSEVYGKAFRESEGSYCVMDGAELVDKFQEMIDNFA